jgi:hypothetical protein
MPVLPYGQYLVWYRLSDAGFSTAEAISNNGRIKCSHTQLLPSLPSFLVNMLSQLVDTVDSYILVDPEQGHKKRL